MPRKPKQPLDPKQSDPKPARKRNPKLEAKAPKARAKAPGLPPVPRAPRSKATTNPKPAIPQPNAENLALIEEFRQRYPFPLDPFQEEAIARLASDESVMVAAPTGTGKTVVAEFGIFRAHSKGFKVMYTTPIKALSNQKFRDLREQYGDAVGLLTGDVIENREGSIIVMTTEVLRNMLLQSPSELWGVGCVIFDEVHYLADPERGTTWEEAIIMCPDYIQLVCLSATVSNAGEVADWIGHTHKPIHLITHLKRAVPLSLYYFLDRQMQLVINAQGQQIADFKVGGEARKKTGGGGGRRYRGPSADEDTAPMQERREPEPREIIEGLERADLLPAIFFLFSRRDCEAAAEHCAMMRLQAMSDPQTLERVNEVLESYLERLSPEDRQLEQVRLLNYLARRGFGFHHAGLLPILKQLVEELFNKTLMRVVFATDTLALGVNMPARTVVIGRMNKYDGVSRRPLIPNEFQQMAGRAGRRGIDPQGHVVIPYSPWVTFHEALNIATGPLRPVESAFTMRYNSVLNLWAPSPLRNQETEVIQGANDESSEASSVLHPSPASEVPNPQFSRVLGVMRASLLQFQQNRRLRDLESELNEEDAHLSTVPVGCLIGYEAGEELLDEYERLGRVLEDARKGERKASQNAQYLQSRRNGLPWTRPDRDTLKRVFRTLPQGALVHIEERGWAIYLGRGLGAWVGLFMMVGDQEAGVGGTEPTPDSRPLVPAGEIVALSEYRTIDFLPPQPVLVDLPFALSTLVVPPTVPLEEMLSAEETEALQSSIRRAFDYLPDLEAWVLEHRASLDAHIHEAAEQAAEELSGLREEVRQVAQAEREHVCHTCPVRKEHRTNRRIRARLLLDRDAAERKLVERRRWEETRLQKTLKGLTNVLVQFNYLRKGELTPKAQKLADLFDTNALMLCEMVEGGYFEKLSPDDVAEVFSWFAYDRDIDFSNRLLLPRFLVNLRRDLDHLQNSIFAAERRQEIALTRGYNPYFYGAARLWCKGTPLADLLEGLDLSEGDLVMSFNKTLDVMRQVREMLIHHDRDHPLLPQLREADRLMRRGVVEMAQSLGFAPAALPEVE